jgi:hypothetical protein
LSYGVSSFGLKKPQKLKQKSPTKSTQNSPKITQESPQQIKRPKYQIESYKPPLHDSIKNRLIQLQVLEINIYLLFQDRTQLNNPWVLMC